jgi:hypothetical protein
MSIGTSSRPSSGTTLGVAFSRSAVCRSALLLTPGLGRILLGVGLCRPVLREVPGSGRSVGRAAVVVRSVKLVHQRIESGEAGTFSWPVFPVSEPRRSCWTRSRRAGSRQRTEGVLGQVPARSHDGSPCANLFVETTSWLPFPLTLAPAREVATGKRSCSDASESDPMATIGSAGNSSPPLRRRARPVRCLKCPGCRLLAHSCPRP